jgi:D-alanyl-D-alanine carboxypeptidase
MVTCAAAAIGCEAQSLYRVAVPGVTIGSEAIVMINHRPACVAVVALAVASLGIVGCSTNSNSDIATPAASPNLSSAPLWAPPGSGDLSAQTADQLQAAIDKWVAQGSLTGMTAAVVTPDGVWSGAAGVDAAGTPLQPDSALSLQSISKTFTAAEVMLLAGRGLVDLDAPITDYVEVPFDTQGATVRQVLAMRSGFPDYTTEASQKVIAADLDREWTVSEALATLPEDAEGLGTVGGPPLYNNLNYQLLAELVAKVTKKTFAQAVRADLIDPAGLRRTWVQTGETPNAPLTVGGQAAYADIVDPDGPFMPSRSFASFTLGPGSIAADAADVARWGYQLYGGQVIDSTLVAQMQADPQDSDVGLYGLGTMVMSEDLDLMIGHMGGGSDWTYTTMLFVWPGDQPVAVAVLAPEPADFASGIYDVFLGLHRIAAPPAEATP